MPARGTQFRTAVAAKHRPILPNATVQTKSRRSYRRTCPGKSGTHHHRSNSPTSSGLSGNPSSLRRNSTSSLPAFGGALVAPFVNRWHRTCLHTRSIVQRQGDVLLPMATSLRPASASPRLITECDRSGLPLTSSWNHRGFPWPSILRAFRASSTVRPSLGRTHTLYSPVREKQPS